MNTCNNDIIGIDSAHYHCQGEVIHSRVLSSDTTTCIKPVDGSSCFNVWDLVSVLFTQRYTHTRMSQIRNHDVCQCVLVQISSGSQTCLKPEDFNTSCCRGQPPANPNAGRVHSSSTYTVSANSGRDSQNVVVTRCWRISQGPSIHNSFTICFPHSKQKRNQRDQQKLEGPADYSVSNLNKATPQQSGSQYCKATPNVLYACYCRESVVLTSELKRS